MHNESEVMFCVELKYCERCGALWLRTAGTRESYCAECFVKLQDWPQAKEGSKRHRAAHRNRSRSRDFHAVAEEWKPVNEPWAPKTQILACDTGEGI